MMERLTIDEMIGCIKFESGEQKRTIEYLEKQEDKEYYIAPHRKALSDCEQIIEWLEELKTYKDAEEQGLFLKLPCKVGSELYVIRKLCDGKETRVIENVIANSFDLRALQRFVITSNGHRLNFSNFGKTVFLTKEEAEQALTEMKEV